MMTVVPSPAPPQRELNLLLVEDDSDDQLLFRIAAERAHLNLRIQTVDDGQQALDYLQGQPPFADRRQSPFPDLVVVDLVLPLVDGLGLLHWLKTSPGFQHLPVVVWSGSVQATGWKERAAALQADACLEKSPRMADLIAALSELWRTLSTQLATIHAHHEALQKAAA